jgi:hypothetical protein
MYHHIINVSDANLPAPLVSLGYDVSSYFSKYNAKTAKNNNFTYNIFDSDEDESTLEDIKQIITCLHYDVVWIYLQTDRKVSRLIVFHNNALLTVVNGDYEVNKELWDKLYYTKGGECLMTRNDEMINTAKQIVVDYFNAHRDVTDDFILTRDNVFIVWFSKTLQNWKALVSTEVSDGIYYEITHDGDRKQTYVDVYKKWENYTVKDSEL